MFEKEAEAYATEHECTKYNTLEWWVKRNTFQEGAKFGYRKAVEKHDLCKNPDDLPEIRHPVYAKLDSGACVVAYCVDGVWHKADDGVILHHGTGENEVIAWCELPKFE